MVQNPSLLRENSGRAIQQFLFPLSFGGRRPALTERLDPGLLEKGIGGNEKGHDMI
jgi:hypothetical protein